jgi:hypothetical protein
MSHTLRAACASMSYAVDEVTDDSFNHRLSLYSVAAMTAGVGMLALVPPAQGEVVVTRKTIPLVSLQEGAGLTGIDFNSDGANDVSFGLDSGGIYGYAQEEVFLKVPKGNGAETSGEARGVPLVTPLLRGSKVGPSARFNAGTPYASLLYIYQDAHDSKCSNPIYDGHWRGNHPDRFVGVKFLIDGETHYGWVRITVDVFKQGLGCLGFSATITSYAYETVANKEITIGTSKDAAISTQNESLEKLSGSPSLGMLALGSDGMALWRRESISN